MAVLPQDALGRSTAPFSDPRSSWASTTRPQV
jgi:hypothetical protein